MNPVGYFEIPVTNLDRAQNFYEGVFGYSLERGEIDGNSMALFPLDEKEAGISGALCLGASYVPADEGCRIYFSTSDIAFTMQKAIDHGGKELYPKTSIGELGWVAEFADSEGNRIGLHEGQPK